MRKSGTYLLILIAIAAATGVAYRSDWLASAFDNRQATAAPDRDAKPTRAASQAVEVILAREIKKTTDISAIGTLQSDESVQLAPELAGRIAEIRFAEGEPVKAGDILVMLDETLARASEEEMKVRLDLANLNAERAQRMAGNGTGTARDLDAAISERSTATALLNLQRVQLSKHRILAPFDGVAGLRTVSTGSYVAVGTTLVNIEKIDTLKLDFKVPEIHLQQLHIGQSIDVSVDAIPERRFSATIYAIDPKIDVNGRAISVRARMENPGLSLRPGLFARILVKGRDERNVVVVPEAAIVARGQDRIVWLVQDGKAVETKVALGGRGRGEVELDGVPPGSTVVTAGHARLRAGVAVDIVGTAPQDPQT